MSKAITGRRSALFGAACLAALTTAALTPAAFAGSNDYAMGADRPAFVPSTSLIGDGNVQVETSVARISDGTGPQLLRVWSTPTLMRFGMPNYEVRLQSTAYDHVRTQNAVNTGVADLEVGLKGVLPQSMNQDLSLSWLVQAAFPSGSSKVKNEGVRPTLELTGQWQMPQGYSLGAMAGIRSDVAAFNDRYPTGIAGVNFARTWNGQVRTYAELAGREIRTAVRGGKNMMWDVGTSWSVMPQTQLDATFGHGLKDNDTDMAWSVGISRRFRPSLPVAMNQREKKAKQNGTPKPDETPSATTEDGK